MLPAAVSAVTPGALWRRLERVLANRSEFARNVAKLSSATALRSAIVFAAVPVVTRLYAAEHLGDLQLMLSIIGLVAAVSALKYDVAIVLEGEPAESDRMAVLSLGIVLGFTALVAAGVYFQGHRLLGFFDAEQLVPYSGLIALGLLAEGMWRVAQQILVARKQFGGLARYSLLQVGCTQGGYVALGLVHPGFLGLFASQIAGRAVAVLFALRRAPLRLRGARLGQIGSLARRHRKFPLVNTPGVFVNSVGAELPVFMLARFFDAEAVGYFMVTMRLLTQPTTLLGQAVARVYLQSAAETRRRSGRALLQLYRTTTKRLALVALPFVALVAVAAPPAAELVLGQGWREVGVFMQLLVLWKYGDFVVTPLMTTFSIVNRQEIGVALMIASTLARFAAMYVFSDSTHTMLAALSITGSLFAVFYLLAIEVVLRAEARRPPIGTASDEPARGAGRPGSGGT